MQEACGAQLSAGWLRVGAGGMGGWGGVREVSSTELVPPPREECGHTSDESSKRIVAKCRKGLDPGMLLLLLRCCSARP